MPSEAVDRAKGVTLRALTSLLLGFRTAADQQALRMIVDEEGDVRKAATLMTDGTLVARGDVAYVNSELALVGDTHYTF